MRLPHALSILLVLAVACRSATPSVAPPPGGGDAAGRGALAAERSAGAVLRGAIGVPPFAALGADSTLVPLAYALADLVVTDLAVSRQLRLVERARLGEVLRELQLSAAGRVDSATAPRVGRLVSAERLVFGSIQPMEDGKTLRLGARVGDVAQSTITRVLDAQAPLEEILAAEKALVARLFESLGVSLTPAERATLEAQPTRNLSALLAYGRGVGRFYDGDFRGASSAFREARRLDPGFGLAASRDQQVRSLGATGTSAPLVIPGVRSLGGAVTATVDRVNRPLDLTTGVSRAVTTPSDPVFPGSQTTLVISVIRP